jgi:hypothetical protein
LIAGEILNMKMQKDFQNVLQLTFNDLKTIWPLMFLTNLFSGIFIVLNREENCTAIKCYWTHSEETLWFENIVTVNVLKHLFSGLIWFQVWRKLWCK